MKVNREKSVEISMTSKGFGGSAKEILSHPNVARDLQKAQASRLVKALKRNRS